MTFVIRRMRNDHTYTECKSDVESDSKVNVAKEVNGKKVNFSDVVPVSVE